MCLFLDGKKSPIQSVVPSGGKSHKVEFSVSEDKANALMQEVNKMSGGSVTDFDK